jgi:hypothetical protein
MLSSVKTACLRKMALAPMAIMAVAVPALLAGACGGSFTTASMDGAADVTASADAAAGADAGAADTAAGPDRTLGDAASGDAASEHGFAETSVADASAVDGDAGRCVPVDSDATLGFYGCENAGPCPLARPCCLAVAGSSHKACEDERSCMQSGYSVFRCGDTTDCTERCLSPQCCAQVSGANLAGSACAPLCGSGFLRLCNPLIPGECAAGLSCQAFAGQPTGLFVCR